MIIGNFMTTARKEYTFHPRFHLLWTLLLVFGQCHSTFRKHHKIGSSIEYGKMSRNFRTHVCEEHAKDHWSPSCSPEMSTHERGKTIKSVPRDDIFPHWHKKVRRPSIGSMDNVFSVDVATGSMDNVILEDKE